MMFLSMICHDRQHPLPSVLSSEELLWLSPFRCCRCCLLLFSFEVAAIVCDRPPPVVVIIASEEKSSRSPDSLLTIPSFPIPSSIFSFFPFPSLASLPPPPFPPRARIANPAS